MAGALALGILRAMGGTFVLFGGVECRIDLI